MAAEYGNDTQFRTLDPDVIRPTRRPAIQPTAPVSPTLAANNGRVIAFNDPRAQGQPDGVWPPPPRIDQLFIFQTGKKPVTPGAAFQFFFGKIMLYGLGFGAAYGGSVGLLIFIIGALYGAPIGAVLGLILGIPEGLVLGQIAAHLVRNGRTVREVGGCIRIATPIATAILGVLILEGYSLTTTQQFFDVYSEWYVLIVYGLAIVASWHASIVAAKKFDAEYE